MSVFVVLASGPSMSQELANSVRDMCRVVAVSDCYKLAPWADHLVSQDPAWWAANPDALKFAGQKWSTALIKGVWQVAPGGIIQRASNSGLLGIEVAKRHGATRILLLGFDLQGTHFFGPHAAPLKNTIPARFAQMQKQFHTWAQANKGAHVVNCTIDSKLLAFPQDSLEHALC